MMNWNIRELKRRGAELAGDARESTRGLVLLYCGVLAVLTLGSSGLNLFLDDRISGTGGLGGLGMRSVLQTVQEVLSYVNLLFGPFWSMGFLAAMLAMVRGSAPEKRHLTAGFRRFGRVLASIAFRFVLGLGLMVAAVNLGTTIFALTPMGTKYAETIAPILSDPAIFTPEGVVNWDLLPMDTFLRATMPVLLVCLAVFFLLYTYISYCFRMADYLILTTSIGAIRAHFVSARLLRGHKRQLLKLDLSFWWYYLLLAAVTVVGYLDLVLGLLGIAVPIDPMVMFFGTLAAYCVLFTALSLWKKCQVDAAYVLAFESIADPQQEEPAAEADKKMSL